MADHGLEHATVAPRRVVAPGADHAVAVREPDGVRAWIARCREAVQKSHFGRIFVAIWQPLESGRGVVRRGALDRAEQPRRKRAMMRGVVLLYDVIVLDANDREAIELMGPREGFDVGDVLRRNARGELDHVATAGTLEMQRVFGVGRRSVLLVRAR